MDKILEQEIGEKLDQERLGNEFARIEARLSSLMPRGMSDGFENEMGSLFCDLAEETNLVETTERDRSHWQGFAKVACLTIAGAAALTIGLQVLKEGGSQSPPIMASLSPEGTNISNQWGSPAVDVLEKKMWISDGEALGVVALDDDGHIAQGWSYQGVEEERVLHRSSGYEVIVQRPFESEYYASTSL